LDPVEIPVEMFVANRLVILGGDHFHMKFQVLNSFFKMPQDLLSASTTMRCDRAKTQKIWKT
jgi:hypothetical protein